MKVTIEERGTFQRPGLVKKVQGVYSLISEKATGEKRKRLETLAKALLTYTPFSYLLTPPEEEILTWLERFLEFIEGRREDVGAAMVPLTEEGRCFLMTNTTDVPYLFDSLQAYLKAEGFRFQVIAHPILSVKRRQGKVTHLGELTGEGPRESFILIETEKTPEGESPLIEDRVRRILTAALEVERDHKEIGRRLRQLEENPGLNGLGEFIAWLRKDNFDPFAYRCLKVEEGKKGGVSLEGPPLGLSSVEGDLPADRSVSPGDLDPGLRERLEREQQVLVETTAEVSLLQRADPLSYIGFRERTGKTTWREHGFWGLFSHLSVDEPAVDVPALRRKVEGALKSLLIPEGCYDWRKSMEIFNTFPKVELFFMGEEEVAKTILSFIALQRQGGIKVVPTRSLSLRGLTLLVIMPREHHSPENLRRLESFLCRYFKAPAADFRVIHVYSDYLSLHVRLFPEVEEVSLDIERLERALTDQVRPWEAKFRMILERSAGNQRGGALWRRYRSAFSEEYRHLTHPRYAVRDVLGLEKLSEGGTEVFELWGPFGGTQEHYRLQFYSFRESDLNELMPFLENLGLRVAEEVDFEVELEENRCFIKSFSVRAGEGSRPLSEVRGYLLEALAAMWRGEVENDYLHRLLVLTGLSWKEIDVFRAYRNYYFQLGTPFTKKRVAFALIHNPGVARLLFAYFDARFRPEPLWADPMEREEKGLFPARMALAEALEQVADVNEDRILRAFFNLIDSTVRCNFFLRRDRPDYFLSFKISALGIMEMPFPRPLYEIYVHSAAMEGIHLRGGRVARGGIRWSDRPDDFRTEVLGLMKTQMTKNTVIVPVGSKGGFVVKTPYSVREEGMALAKEAYKSLMRGLLDLTDNRVGGKVVHPEGIVPHDDFDPYLVVAADKGTAHLPDTANEVSGDYGFWLGDAFASGGSRGYDHKKLGITARGAWECVKRHFREMGRDIQKEPFTAVGIGDMSGDVFGNGMLLSRQTRLLGAFDHRHVFLDPDPDPASSFAERQRLFDLPRSSWADYDPGKISKGGGVWPRTTKEIPLSPQVRRWLGVRHESIDGDGLIRLLLTAEVDLLWNGGIGTYVKASTEKNEDAGDRANDGVRVDATQVRARVLGEGGNLGLTQKGRIEYALGGGRINTDAIDNSAGVDTSDHEVNLKIFMQHLQEQGRVSSLEERDTLLSEVTDEVCDSVLFNNYSQSLSLSLDRVRCQENVEPFLELSDRLVNAGLLDRQSEALAGRKEVLTRGGYGFTRPELAILLAYSKMHLYQALLESSLPDHPGALHLFEQYFPGPVRERFRGELPGHPLVREITATMINNRTVDQAGCAFFHTLSLRTGAPLIDGVGAYLTFDLVLDGEAVRRAVTSLDNRMPAPLQQEILLRLEKALGNLCGWALENGLSLVPEAKAVEDYKVKAERYMKDLAGILPGAEWEGCRALAERYAEGGLPRDLAVRVAGFAYMEDFLPLSTIADRQQSDLASVARVLTEVRQVLGLPGLLEMLGQVPLRDRWDRMANQALRGSLLKAAFRLTEGVFDEGKGNLEAFLGRRRRRYGFYKGLREGVQGVAPSNFHPLSVVARALEGLAGEGG